MNYNKIWMYTVYLLGVSAFFGAIIGVIYLALAGINYLDERYSVFGKFQAAQFELCMKDFESSKLTDEVSQAEIEFCKEVAKFATLKKRRDLERLLNMVEYCTEDDSIHFDNEQPSWAVKGDIVYDYILMRKYDCKAKSYSAFEQ